LFSSLNTSTNCHYDLEPSSTHLTRSLYTPLFIADDDVRMSSAPITPPRRTSSRNAVILDDNDDIDTTVPFPVRDTRPTSPSPSTSDFSVIGVDEADGRDFDSFWTYNTGTPYRGGPFGSFGRRVIYSTPTLNLLSSSYSGGSDDYANGGTAGAGMGPGSGAGAAIKSLFPRIWDVLVSSPTKTILSTSIRQSNSNSPSPNRHRNSSYSVYNTHRHAHTHPYTPPTGSRLTKSKNHREARPCNCASRIYSEEFYTSPHNDIHPVEPEDNSYFVSPATSVVQDFHLSTISPPLSPSDTIRRSHHSLSSQYSYININFSDLPPLDGEEGELIDIDDEACYVPSDQYGPYGAYATWNTGTMWRHSGKGSFSRARVVTGIDILFMLPTEIALVVMEMLVVATSASTPPQSEDTDNAQTNDGNRRSTYRSSRLSSFNLEPVYVSNRNYTPEQALQDLLTCTLVSKRWKELAMDNSSWKAAYEGRWGRGIVGGGITKEKAVVDWYIKRQLTRKRRASWMSFMEDPMWDIPLDLDTPSDIPPSSSPPSLDYLILYKERLELDRRWTGSAFEKRYYYHRKALNPLSLPPSLRPKLRRHHRPTNVITPVPLTGGGLVYVPYAINLSDSDDEDTPQPAQVIEDDDAWIKRMNAMLQAKAEEYDRSRMTSDEPSKSLKILEETKKKLGISLEGNTGSTTAVYAKSTHSNTADSTTASYDVVSNSEGTSSWELTSNAGDTPVSNPNSSSRSRLSAVARSVTPRRRAWARGSPGIRQEPEDENSAAYRRRAWAYDGRPDYDRDDDSASSSSESGSGSGSGSGSRSGSTLNSVSTLRARARNFPSKAFGSVSRSKSRITTSAISPPIISAPAKKAESPGPPKPRLSPEERRKAKEKEIQRLLRGEIRIDNEYWAKWEPMTMKISGHVDRCVFHVSNS